MNATRIRLRADGLRWSEHGGEVVVRDDARSMSYTLNHSAAILWMTIADGVEIPDLITMLCAEYDVDPATARTDVERFVAALDDYGLLEH